MADVLLFQTDNDGDVEVVDGQITLTDSPATAAYVSLFGGNEDDAVAWWGNLDEVDPNREMRSRTQDLLRSLPAIPANLLRVQKAVENDLAWMLETGVAQSLDVSVTMPGLNRIKIVATLDGVPLEYVEDWGSQ